MAGPARRILLSLSAYQPLPLGFFDVHGCGRPRFLFPARIAQAIRRCVTRQCYNCEHSTSTGDDVISALLELRERGCFGEECLALVLKLLREELRQFPALSNQEFEDVTHDFLVDRIKPLTAALLAQATSDASLGKLLRTSIKNWLIDRARATGTGPLRRTIEKVLSTTSLFERVAADKEGAGRWRLANSDSEPWGGNVDDLIATAWSVQDVRVPKWASDTRRPPIADRASLVEIIRAVLERAGGSLETADLVIVFANRFAAALDPLVVSIDDDENTIDVAATASAPEETLLADAVALDVATAAAEIAGRLTQAERAIVPLLGDSSSIQQRLGKGRSQSAAIAAKLKSKVRELAGTGADAEEVVREVVALCGGVPPDTGQIER
jgi:hypothetical protein